MKATVDIPQSLVDEKIAKELAMLRRKVAKLERQLEERDSNKELVEKFKYCIERLKGVVLDYDYWNEGEL